MKKSVLISALIVLTLSACNEKEVINQNNEVISTPVEIQTVAMEDISNVNRINGSVIAQDEVSIFAPVSGEVTGVNVKVGDKVTKNQILFSVDNASLTRNYQALVDDYNRTKDLYDKQIALVEQSLQDTKTIYNEQVRLAKQTADNTKALFEVGAATSIDVENAEFALNQAQIGAKSAIEQAEITLTSTKNSAESTLTQLRNSMKDVQETLDKTYAKSTIDGTVTMVNVKKGSMASPQAVAIMVSGDTNQQIKISVSEKIVPYIAVGDTADVRINALGTDVITCIVDSVSPSPNAATHLYDIYLNLPDNVKGALGMFAEVTLKTDVRADSIVIPTQTILTDGETQFVYVTDDEIVAKKVVIETGLVGDGVTQVTSGLTAGDNLIVKGQNYLSDGSSLRVVGRE